MPFTYVRMSLRLNKLLKEVGIQSRFFHSKGAYMSQEISARLLPQKPSKWAKILLNRKVPIFLFFLLELAFLVFSYISLQEHFPSIILWEHLLSVFTFFYLLNRSMDSRSKLSWLIIIALFPIFGTALLYFSLADFGVRRLKKRLVEATVQASDYLATEPEVEDYLSHSDRQLQRLAYFLEHSPAHFPIYGDTEVTYFPLGDDMLPALLEDLKKAERYIFMEYFIIDEGVMWGEILAILEEKAKAGLDVRVMFDGMNEMTTLSYDYIERLHKVGIKAQAFSPVKPILSTYYNYRDHRKITVIDGQVAYTGGVNIADEYVNKRERFGHWKDTALRLDGSAVQTLKALFLTMWSVTGVDDPADMDRYLQEKPQKKKSEGLVLPYANSPLTYHKVAENVYLHLLNTSTDHVYIMTPYLILDDELVRAMTFAARRGVDVRIIMPGIPDKQYAFDIATTYFKALLGAGVRIFRYTPGFVHAKIYISDAKQAVVGTINTDYRSLYQNFENGIYLYKNIEVLKIEQDFEVTQALSEEVTLESLSKMPMFHRLGGYLFSLIGPLM